MAARGPFEKFVDSFYYSESELYGGSVTISFLKYLRPLLENVNGLIKWVHELFKRPS
jgi:hypothetical protein